MASIIQISDFVHISYEKIFQVFDGDDVTGEQYLVLDFVYCIDGEMIEHISNDSRHQFAQCGTSSYIRDYIHQHDPVSLDTLIDPVDAENVNQKISEVVASLVGQCVGVEGLKMLVVDIVVEVNQEVNSFEIESYGVEFHRERRIDMLFKKVYDGEGMKNVDCAICLNEMSVGEKIVCTPCVHWFHEYCIGRWFEKASNCPLCRSNIELF